MTKLKVAVIFGGASPEHEVSIITAVQAMAAMPKEYEVIPLYVTKEGKVITDPVLFSLESYRDLPLLEQMAEHVNLPISPSAHTLTPTHPKLFTNKSGRPFDILFPMFHGGVGEGGWIQGLAEYYQIPMVGTGLTGAALGMDKIGMKSAFAGAKIPQAKYTWFYRQEWTENQAPLLKKITSSLHFPLFVKPSRGGSSIGTTKVHNQTELIQALDVAATLDTRLVVEEGIENAREINISVMGNAGTDLEYSACEEVFHTSSEFFDFTDKYLTGGKIKGMASADRVIPANIPPATVSKIRSLAGTIFNLLDCAGLVRIDFLIKEKDVYVIEINTIPGCLSFFLWDKANYSYPQLLSHLIKLALAHYQESSKTRTEFASPILANPTLGSKLGKKLSR